MSRGLHEAFCDRKASDAGDFLMETSFCRCLSGANPSLENRREKRDVPIIYTFGPSIIDSGKTFMLKIPI